ncbi:hypothetical protein AAGW18_24240 [Vreelandella titanicae]|uniref:hypothetical protein n=1 Tax=Vreelandella titanicae TaxID=664683 RepID=UPI003158F47C
MRWCADLLGGTPFYRVAMGLVAVLAADQAHGGVVTLNNHLRSRVALQAAEAHPAQSVVLIALLAGAGEVIELTEVVIHAL